MNTPAHPTAVIFRKGVPPEIRRARTPISIADLTSYWMAQLSKDETLIRVRLFLNGELAMTVERDTKLFNSQRKE